MDIIGKIAERIEPGDVVRIMFSSRPDIMGTVLGLPCATGDSWRIREDRRWPGDSLLPEKDWKLIYVQQFDTMTLLEKKS